jgi:VanZ family protein
MTEARVAKGRMAAAILVSAALIFATPFIGQLRSALLRIFPDRFALVAGVAIGIAIAATLAAALWRIRDRRLLRYGAIGSALLMAVGYALLAQTGNPLVDAVERFHFVEYGLVTLLFWRAWSPVGDASLLILPVLAGLLVATAEEWVQWFIPARVGELRDVFLNLWAIICGVLFSLGLDPPSRLALSIPRDSWRRILRLALMLILSLGAFIDSVHLGHRIEFDGGAFKSRYRTEQLEALAAARAAAWRAQPPMTWSRISREDQYMTEGVQHVQRRNEAWQANDIVTSWHENLILERFFAPVLDTPSFVSATGHRWIPGHRAEAASRYLAPPAQFESDADETPVFVWPRAVFWSITITLVVMLEMAARWSRIPSSGGRQ